MCGGINHSDACLNREGDNACSKVRGEKMAVPPEKNHNPDLDLEASAEELISRLQGRVPEEEEVIKCNVLGKPVSVRVRPAQKAEDLSPQTPSVEVTTLKEAMSPDLLNFCLASPISVVRNLGAVCGMDLGLYSSKTLAYAWPEHPVEIRTQNFTNEEENIDVSGLSSWACQSVRSQTTVKKYAEYQAQTYVTSSDVKFGQKRRLSSENEDGESDNIESISRKFFGSRQIRFGTNCDLSDETMWGPQLRELQKLPPLFRVYSPANMLSHVGHSILGMNTVQLYMKVKGSRTPGHQENNNFCAVNVNIGPEDTEWFAASDEYWGAIYDLCKKNKIEYLSGSWWPVAEDCVNAGIPVHRFLQKPGDLVFINLGCVHWVQAQGWCNNIAWNVGPLTAKQMKLALERYEFNKLERFKSIVAMISLSWNLARNVRVQDAELFSLLKGVLQRSLMHSVKIISFCKALNVSTYFHGKDENETSNYCEDCDEEVWNTLFIKQEAEAGEHLVYCVRCALQADQTLENYYLLLEYKTEDLKYAYDHFTLHCPY